MIQTTCIGAYPKPDYLKTGNWREIEAKDDIPEFSYTNDAASSTPREILDQATSEVIADQVECGVDIPTDGEQRRENYIHYHCRHLTGIDFQNLTEKVHRNGAAVAKLPTICGEIKPDGEHFLDADYRFAQSTTTKPVKITIPGPLTIMDTTANQYYESEKQLAFDLATALNFEVRALAEAGCRYIQIDEPLFARQVDKSLEFGIESLERCFHNIPDSVTRVMHMCCGYPAHLDDDNYLKADPDSYFQLADALDRSPVDQISIEDAHCLNDLNLLEKYSRSSIILGSVAIASSRLESVEEIRHRIQQALNHIDKDRLLAAPDCGLMMLDRSLAMQKLKNLCDAAHSI